MELTTRTSRKDLPVLYGTLISEIENQAIDEDPRSKKQQPA
jgi:hypothetical protein